MNTQNITWSYLTTGPNSEDRLLTVMDNVSHGLSTMVGRSFTHSLPRVKAIPLGQVATCMGPPEGETVGVYLQMQGDMRGQAILTFPLSSAMHLVDFLMHTSVGTSTYLGLMQRSALAEVGNLMVAYFLNSVANMVNAPDLLRPSPPAVIVDMLAAILNLVFTPASMAGEEVVVIETNFQDAEGYVKGCFWILPTY